MDDRNGSMKLLSFSILLRPRKSERKIRGKGEDRGSCNVTEQLLYRHYHKML